MGDRIRRSLNLSLFDSFLYALMVGAGETYLPAYVLSLGLSEWMAGLISTMPLLSGAFLQILSTEALRAFRNHKIWVWSLAFLQAVTFIPLIFFALGSRPHFWTLFLILTFYWGAGFSVGPSWNYWMSRLVTHDQASQFFSKRTRLSQVGILLGLLIGGIALHNKVRLGPFTSTFGLIFFFAFICRAISSWALSRHHYEETWSEPQTLLRIRESWSVFWAQKEKRNFILRLLPFQMGIFLSSPYVTPYMLAHLHMNYARYMVAVAFLLMGKVTSLWVFEKSKNLNYHAAFKFGLFLLCPAPVFWTLSGNFEYVLALQFVSGAGWALFEIGLALIFFQDLNAEEKIPFLTFYNFMNATGLLIGSGLGAYWLRSHHAVVESYLAIFAVGASTRVVTGFILYRQSKRFVGILQKRPVYEQARKIS